MTVVDLFAGPGGADEGLRAAGFDVVGVEWDADACATAEAAGHRRVRADVSELDPPGYPCDGLWASPPCQAWSMAGKRAALADQGRLGRHAETCRGGWVAYDPSDYADARTPLVLEPLRWADALRPRWVVCEQVPPVADLWAHYVDVLRGWGYHAWAGVLNAADYGVPQTRRRALLVARLDGPAGPPDPTHARHPQDAGLFDDGRLPWVTMAEALAWDGEVETGNFTAVARDPDGGRSRAGSVPYRRGTDEPAPTVDTSSDRWKLASRRDSPSWVEEHGERPDRTDDEPAPAITGEAHRWSFVAAGETGEGRPRNPDQQPAATLGTKGTAYWTHERPATSVCADPRIPEPGYRGGRRDYEQGLELERSGDNAVRVTVAQAAILQGFPADYPWQGSKTSQFSQVGNAVPPPLAAAVGRLLQDS